MFFLQFRIIFIIIVLFTAALMVNTRCMLCLELADGTMLPVNESRCVCREHPHPPLLKAIFKLKIGSFHQARLGTQIGKS